MTVFDYINSVAFSKKKINVNCEDESQFTAFMMNRWLSFYSPDVNSFINDTSNFYSPFRQKSEQYDFYYNMLPKMKFKKIAYIKKTKKEKEVKEVQLVPDFMSRKEYKDNVELMESIIT